MVGNCRPSRGELRNHEEIIVVRDDFLRNYGTCGHILHAIAHRLEKSLVSLGINQNKCDIWSIHGINFLQFLKQRVNHEGMVDSYLIVGAAVGKNNNLFWRLLVTFAVCVDQLQQSCHHAA